MTPDVRALLSRSRAKAGLPPLAPPPAPTTFAPRSRVHTAIAGRRPERAHRGTVVEAIDLESSSGEVAAWIYWLADDGARHLSHPSYLVPEPRW